MTSPIFDPVSGFGGNGAKIPATDKSSPYSHSPNGGGCITDGPLKNLTLRIGPYGKMVAGKPRCLRRDLNPLAVEGSATKKTLSTILNAKTYSKFSSSLSGALHNVGHGGIGGEVSQPLSSPPILLFHSSNVSCKQMSDEFNSINDILFFLHHSNLDYFWALWQAQDTKRLKEFSAPPGTVLDMGLYAPQRMAEEVLDTENRDGKGVLCYRYEGLKMSDYAV